MMYGKIYRNLKDKEKLMQKSNPFNTDVAEYEEWFKTNDKLLESELEAIRQLIPISGDGVEIGVGTGIFASRLGIRYGVEPSEKMAAEAMKKGVNVLYGVAEKIPVEDESYQFVLMVTVDCFLDDVPKAFSEVRRILMNNGIFIIAFLDKATPLGELYEQNKHQHKSYQNANFHTSTEIVSFLITAGFEIVDKRQTIYSLENTLQEIKIGVGEGVFAVIKAKKI
ncbi:class I SAM-dependent methyltransferase [Tissierella creatinini]|nr:class I SAM-dependent methyltransferase [Tissierella creatinini]TJX58663.1 class I SAM-dependent methyltransferase [Soehngenia saccharolytica]